MTNQVSKASGTSQQQVAQQSQSQAQRDVETQERSAKASASGGLNLNIFGALSGALSSKSRKETHTNPDGSKKAVEDRDTKAVAQGAAQGNGSAYAAADAEEGGKRTKERMVGQAQETRQGKIEKKVDHLGIEA